MKIKCEYCGTFIDDTNLICDICGANNDKVKRVSNGVPKTIEELKIFCKEHNLPLNDMRFFIGVDYKETRAFGIYKDENSGNFIVYKNKDDGSRFIRYEGKDEVYAVNEIYLKIKDEIVKQKEYRKNKSNNNVKTTTFTSYDNKNGESVSYQTTKTTSEGSGLGYIIMTIVLLIMICQCCCSFDVGNVVEDVVYETTGLEFDFSDNYSESSSSSSWNDDWDDDYSWDSSSSWDSGSTDWSSDW